MARRDINSSMMRGIDAPSLRQKRKKMIDMINSVSEYQKSIDKEKLSSLEQQCYRLILSSSTYLWDYSSYIDLLIEKAEKEAGLSGIFRKVVVKI